MLELARQHIAALGRPDFSSKIKLYTGEIPLFSHYQIESQIEVPPSSVKFVCHPVVRFVIDSTEALTAIDINSARATRGGDIERKPRLTPTSKLPMRLLVSCACVTSAA